MTRYILNRDRHIVPEPSLLLWKAWMGIAVNRTVCRTEIAPGVAVSTVFLGIDQNEVGRGPPILFETLVLGGPLDGRASRYSSWDDAETGHKVVVRRVCERLGVA